MGKYTGTIIRNEPDDRETVYFVPSYHSDHVIAQSVAVAPLENNELSIIFSKVFDLNGEVDTSFSHFVFTKEETDLLLNAIIEAKNRWETENVIKG